MSTKKGILMTDDGIDVVLLWVDGGDPLWLSDRRRYEGCCDGDIADSRFRDWDNLQFMFRSFEVCLPWVRRIHFVTCGHLPAWLNVDHPKLNIVKHSHFLVKKNLPVFNSQAIECSIHKIPGLSDRFIYFNDDTFVLSALRETDFFIGNRPRDAFALNVISTDITAHVKINDLQILSKYFNKYNFIFKNIFKVFSVKYGLELIKTFLLLPWPQFTGFYNHHMPQPFLRSTFDKVWDLEPDILKKTSSSRFRNDCDVNQYLFKWWNVLEGNFVPRSYRKSKKISIWRFDDALLAASIIKCMKFEMICINDHLSDGSFEESKRVIAEAFSEVFPNKSSFEM